MARVSNFVVAFLNVLILAVAVLAIGFSMWFKFNDGSLCQRFLHQPLLYTGLALLVISVIGLIGSCCRISCFLWIYLAVLFLTILGLICFTFFAFIVTNHGAGKALSHHGVDDEHGFGDYSKWLQRYVLDAENWAEIKSCLADAQFCQQIPPGQTPQFYKQNLPLLQSACCKPPTYCGMEPKNGTFWEMPKSGPAVPDSDCTTFSNVQTQLCFDCKSCKSSFLYNIKREWKTVAIINACLLCFVVFVYSVGCCALRSNRNRNRNRGYFFKS